MLPLDKRPAPPAKSDLERRIDLLLPPKFAGGAACVRSMGSASLKYDGEGRVAWNEIWTTFCDLALAGGPPHRGTLLDFPAPADVDANGAEYRAAAAELARGVRLTTGLAAASRVAGRLTVFCSGEGMADWLLRAVVAENVAAVREGSTLLVPVAPPYRPHKEIKNVVVALAKSCHYWQSHMSPVRRDEVAAVLAAWGGPAPAEGGWLGVDFADEEAAAAALREAAAENHLARREGRVLFVAVPADEERRGEVLSRFSAAGSENRRGFPFESPTPPASPGV